MTSNPCLNDATCIPSSPQAQNRRRFQCLCVNGYHGDRCETPCPAGKTGQRCEQPIRSCRGYSNRVSKEYTVLDDDQDNPFKVYCDFDNNSSLVWTLLQPDQLNYEDNFSISFSLDKPFSQDRSSQSNYLSKSRMESIERDSTKQRLTWRYNTDGLVYTDYLRASTNELNILTFKKCGECIRMENISVRCYGQCGTVYMVQKSSTSLQVKVEAVKKNGGCNLKLTKSTRWNNECRNWRRTERDEQSGHHRHRCHSRHASTKCCCISRSEATTQKWLGGGN